MVCHGRKPKGPGFGPLPTWLTDLNTHRPQIWFSTFHDFVKKDKHSELGDVLKGGISAGGTPERGGTNVMKVNPTVRGIQ